jgi:hypothetical protein
MTDLNRPDEIQAQREQEQKELDRREQRMMWIFSGSVVLLILGAMGANMLFHKDSPAAANTDISSQSRAAPANQ